MTPIRLLSSVALALSLVQRADAQNTGGDTLTAKLQSAQEAATRWLALVDSGRYAASWENAAKRFKAEVTGPQWQAAVIEVRSQINPLSDRRLVHAEYTREIPDAPRGEYVVMQFSTAARGNARVVETISVILEGGKNWRVIGYFIADSP